MELLPDTPGDDSDPGDFGLGSTLTEDSIDKGPSQIGLVLGVLALLSVGVAVVFGGAASTGPVISEPPMERAADTIPAQTLDTTPAPVSTAMTQINGGDTYADNSANRKPGSAMTKEAMPDRGAFRESFVALLVANCDHLIDGPEPISGGLYRQHGRCVNLALVDLDERCRLAAAFFYVYPGDEAVDIACDIQGEPSPKFRESVRQSMVLKCDNEREARIDPTHEAYYEYDRCLQQIDPHLDETCYLVARAQFMEQVERDLRTACEIGNDVDLSAISG